ncbi:MAG: NADH-quinone oxidoreductase subunit I [Kiloniellales bacterium]|nr:NADH-quinone oxidoreductase subunit I [Kiloniellales bacterium]
MKRREEMTLLERLYVWEIAKGVSYTSGRLIRNLTRFLVNLAPIKALFGLLGVKIEGRPWATMEYPDEVRKYPARFRGRHRLTLNDDGTLRCTACFLCATACPANCIYIEAAEHEDPNVEKFPGRYEIDTLLCIYCGYCVDACPVDAIRMDTGIHPEIYPPDPRAFIEDKEMLMQRSRVLEDEGPDALFKAHLKRMQEIEKRPFAES